MAFSLRDKPINRKLWLAMLLTSSFALLLMGTSLIGYEVITFRRSLAASINMLAQIIGSNSTAALAFQDKKTGQEVLGALAAERQITAAALYDDQGKLFASFPATILSSEFPARPGNDGYAFDKAHLIMFRPIVQEGDRLGTIFLRADLDQMYSRILVYGALLMVVGVCSFLAAIPLSAGLQRRISTPILALAKVARAVSEHQDYSVRGTKQGGDEIGQLTDAFNQMLTRIGQTTEDLSKAKEVAEAANNAKDNFLAVLSHELRTPLTPVLTTVAMLEEDPTIPRHAHHELDLIRRNIEVEARLIDDLLDVTGIIRGKLDLHRQVVDVRALLEHVMQIYCAGIAAQKNLRLSIDVTAMRTHVWADTSRMTQVFWNLLQNACKFTPEGGAIDIRLANEPNGNNPELVVEISDTGIGISPETMPRIFDPFEQGERSRTRLFGGLGLGLAISRAIVELHGGSISAESEGEGQGTNITIRLETVSTPAIRAIDTPRPLPGPLQTRRLRVLLVEDHRDTADQLARLLQRAGHEVTCAGTIKEARESARSAEFDILISDLGLPDGTGYELMRQISRERRIPGIALSGFGMKDDVQNSIAAGFARHLTKPVDWQQLKTEIQRVAEAGA
jgi:signal transduction histidine kinase